MRAIYYYFHHRTIEIDANTDDKTEENQVQILYPVDPTTRAESIELVQWAVTQMYIVCI